MPDEGQERPALHCSSHQLPQRQATRMTPMAHAATATHMRHIQQPPASQPRTYCQQLLRGLLRDRGRGRGGVEGEAHDGRGGDLDADGGLVAAVQQVPHLRKACMRKGGAGVVGGCCEVGAAVLRGLFSGVVRLVTAARPGGSCVALRGRGWGREWGCAGLRTSRAMQCGLDGALRAAWSPAWPASHACNSPQPNPTPPLATRTCTCTGGAHTHTHTQRTPLARPSGLPGSTPRGAWGSSTRPCSSPRRSPTGTAGRSTRPRRPRPRRRRPWGRPGRPPSRSARGGAGGWVAGRVGVGVGFEGARVGGCGVEGADVGGAWMAGIIGRGLACGDAMAARHAPAHSE